MLIYSLNTHAVGLNQYVLNVLNLYNNYLSSLLWFKLTYVLGKEGIAYFVMVVYRNMIQMHSRQRYM